MEVIGLPKEVRAELTKACSINLCPAVQGQICMALVMKPPKVRPAASAATLQDSSGGRASVAVHAVRRVGCRGSCVCCHRHDRAGARVWLAPAAAATGPFWDLLRRALLRLASSLPASFCNKGSFLDKKTWPQASPLT